MTSIAPTLQGFFTDRLVSQRHASSRTIASYRDSLRLLLAFAQQRTGKPPNALDWADLDAELISAFLDHLETERHNSTRTRNLRLTAIRSLFTLRGAAPPRARRAHPAGPGHPRQAVRQAAHLVPHRRPRSTPCSPRRDLTRWEGRRDRALLLVAAQTGLRVSELTGLNCGDVTLGTGATSAARAKAASTAPSRSPRPPRRCCASGSPNAPDRPASRCSPPAPDGASAATPSQRLRPHSTPPPPPTAALDPAGQAAPPRPAAQLRHDAAARRRRHRRHRALARPRRHPLHQRLPARRHDHQGAEPSPSPPPRPHRPAATAPPTRCSPSSKACNYAEHRRPRPPQKPAPPSAFASRCGRLGIVPGSA